MASGARQSRPARARRFAAAQARTRAISARIECRLQDLGINQTQLARDIGISTSTMSRILLGESVIQARVITAAARALDVSARWLAHGDEAPPFAVGASEALVRAALTAMTPADRRRLLLEFLTKELALEGRHS